MKGKMLIEETNQIPTQFGGFTHNSDGSNFSLSPHLFPTKCNGLPKETSSFSMKTRVNYLNRPKRANLENNPCIVADTSTSKDDLLIKGLNKAYHARTRLINIGICEDKPSLCLEMNYCIAQRKTLVTCGCTYRNRFCKQHSRIIKCSRLPYGSCNHSQRRKGFIPTIARSVNLVYNSKSNATYRYSQKANHDRSQLLANNFKFLIGNRVTMKYSKRNNHARAISSICKPMTSIRTNHSSTRNFRANPPSVKNGAFAKQYHQPYTKSRMMTIQKLAFQKWKKENSMLLRRTFVEVKVLCLIKDIPDMSRFTAFFQYRKECAKFWSRNLLALFVRIRFSANSLKKLKHNAKKDTTVCLPQKIKERISAWCGESNFLRSPLPTKPTCKGDFFHLKVSHKKAIAYNCNINACCQTISAENFQKNGIEPVKTENVQYGVANVCNSGNELSSPKRVENMKIEFLSQDWDCTQTHDLCDFGQIGDCKTNCRSSIMKCHCLNLQCTLSDSQQTVNGSVHADTAIVQRVSSRLQKKRDSGIQGRYEADYLVEIPTSKKAKKLKLTHPYSHSCFWKFYDKLKYSQKCKLQILTRSYVKYGQHLHKTAKKTIGNAIGPEDILKKLRLTTVRKGNQTTGSSGNACCYCDLPFDNLSENERNLHKERHHMTDWPNLTIPSFHLKRQFNKPRLLSEDVKGYDVNIASPSCSPTKRVVLPNTNGYVKNKIKLSDKTSVAARFSNSQGTIPRMHNPFKRATARKSNIAW